MTRTIEHWVSGRSWPGRDSERGPVTDPATGEVTAQVLFATSAEVDVAVQAAAHAFPAWSATSLARRTRVLFAFRELLNSRAHELAAIITAEHGKVLDDAAGEVARGQEVVEFACGLGHLMKGSSTVSASTNVDVHSIREPLGPVAIIGPFNFPAMVPLWFFPIAIAAGNTVVLKPSEKVPTAAVWIARLWKEAGLPDGVFNVVHGGRETVDALLTHPGIQAVSFVGSTGVAEHVYRTASAAGKRVQAFGGAKNHMVVVPGADLDLAADQAVNAGYGSAGERCMAISVCVAVGDIGDELVEKIRSRTEKLRTGDGRRACDMGPLVSAAARDRVKSYIDAGVGQGAELVVDGREVQPDADGEGFFVGPTLFDHVGSQMSIYRDEIFGPVLSVVRVDDLGEAIALINSNPFGNGTAVFTDDGGIAKRFESEVQVGMVGVNVPVPVPMAYYSFGGWKSSLFGGARAHGTDGLDFFTRTKVVTSRWPERRHSGIDLGFPQNA